MKLVTAAVVALILLGLVHSVAEEVEPRRYKDSWLELVVLFCLCAAVGVVIVGVCAFILLEGWR
jgi:hypothetical protein